MPETPQLPTPADLARMLTQVSGGIVITESQILTDIAAGAPATADGRVNVLHYVAWLLNPLRSDETSRFTAP